MLGVTQGHGSLRGEPAEARAGVEEVSVDSVLGRQAGSQVSCDCTGAPQGLSSCVGLLTPAPNGALSGALVLVVTGPLGGTSWFMSRF